MRDASWVVCEKTSKAVLFETFSPATVAKLNKEKYEALPITDYLSRLNGSIRADAVIKQMGEIIRSKRSADLGAAIQASIKNHHFATSWIWIVSAKGSYLIPLDLPMTAGDGALVLNYIHPARRGTPWDLYLIDATSLKVQPIAEAEARKLVAARPTYELKAMKIWESGSLLAIVGVTTCPDSPDHCHVQVDCRTQPTEKQKAVIKRIAYEASTYRATDGAYDGAAVIEVRYAGNEVVIWKAPADFDELDIPF